GNEGTGGVIKRVVHDPHRHRRAICFHHLFDLLNLVTRHDDDLGNGAEVVGDIEDPGKKARSVSKVHEAFGNCRRHVAQPGAFAGGEHDQLHLLSRPIELRASAPDSSAAAMTAPATSAMASSDICGQIGSDSTSAAA